jgi:hypothetical protein
MRNKLLLTIRYEGQVYAIILSEQLNKKEKELKREESLNIRGDVSPGGRGKEVTC